MKRLFLIPFAALLAAPPASAQNMAETVFRDFFIHLPSDAWYVATAPTRMGEALPEAAAFTGAVLTLAALDGPIQDGIRDHRDAFWVEGWEVFGEEGIETVGATQTLMWTSGTLYTIGLVSGIDAIREAGIGCAEADGFNALIRDGVYRLIRRDRPSYRQPGGAPDLRNDDPYRFAIPGGPWNAHAFFGGHAANVMSCASFWTHRFDLGVLEPVLLGVAVGVGVARTVEERHWASDTLVGMAFGWLMGRGIAGRFAERAAERADEEAAGSSGAGLGAAPGARPLLDRVDLRLGMPGGGPGVVGRVAF